ncbi:hypothetical protein HG536_0A02960 [Torulaspora globosa]|uniref:Cysteine protease RIM13 n=1 Tax=Torulaspora globosa TaxID=48254 RepID=A0A7G3ZAE3_9SACH|nr:uncharacterized protein HG536_0A02960 [Torulaspora globosa]QLL30479.1 hypothetical protein HG536_0A02960 [Torulaspora globosa]
MNHWQLLNDVRKSVYCSRNDDYSIELKELVSLASKSNDSEFIKCVLLLREDITSANAKVKLLWLTSLVGKNFYAPLDVDLAGPLPWNGPHILDTRSARLQSKYAKRSPLRPEDTPELRQCQDINNCSFVASLIGLKVHNVRQPKIKQLSPDVFSVNLHFNGASDRVVTVSTSQIPTDGQSNQLSIHSGDLADKVVELAYLQITAGSYDTHGSNCAIDTFRLTGYLPEVKAANRIDIKRLIKYFRSGLCIIALGTGADASMLVAPLITDHDYAVVAVDDDRESLTIRDPLNPETCVEVRQNDLWNHYEQVYLNWCQTKLFYYKTCIHFFYKAECCNRFNSITDKPLFIIKNRSKSKQPVRVLLETNLREEVSPGKRIAYLKEVPNDILSSIHDEPTGACDIGLQLLKLELLPGQSVRLFCHSSHSESFTTHMFYNSELVSFNREIKSGDYRSIIFDAPDNGISNSCQFYRNPSIMLKVKSPLSEEVPLNLQLLSESSKDMINAQVYHASDHKMSRPLREEANFEQQKLDIRYLHLITNTPYKVVCSSYSKALSHKFKLNVKPSSSEESIYSECKLKQVYFEFGGFPHHLEKRFGWPSNSNRIRIRLTSKSNNLCFIRISPMASSPSLSIRCNIFDEETHGQLHTMTQYEKPGLGGLVIDQLSIDDCTSIVLLIEKDEALLSGIPLRPIECELLIGSQTTVSFNE